MVVLFVHGMGRTSASGWLMLKRLRRAGHQTATFGYSVNRESFRQITGRLASRLTTLLQQGEVVLVGHSLGGVLLREGLSMLAPSGRQPAHLYLLGSPVQASRLAASCSANRIFRWATADCGQLLASAERMSAVPTPSVPVTGIAGTLGLSFSRNAFAGETNDGVVSLSEVSARWLSDQVHLPVVHTWLPSSRRVSNVLVDRLQRHAG